MPKSAYIHIPFCKKKCKYCSFTSWESLELKNIYVDALLKEIKHFYDGEKLNTLYIGGGTPSLLGVGDFEEILSTFNFEDKNEITVEVNPESATREYFCNLKKTGVNRISIGVQSFNDNILREIGRLHGAVQAKNIVKMAQDEGFENISIDLIYGLPNQDIKIWEHDLETAGELGIQHISLYGLKIDKGCYFYNNRPDNLANDDIQADMYLRAIDILSDFCHYEISNFAKNENFKGAHNLNYWNLGYYWGFGVVSSGFLKDGRYQNNKNIEKYIKNPIEKKVFEKTNLLDEAIFLGFRKIDGINTDDINKKFNISFEKKYNTQLEKFTPFILKTKNGYRLSTQGIMLSNSILCEFLEN